MSGTWIDVSEALPLDKVDVLAVKQLKNGDRSICIANCIREYEHFDYVRQKKVVEPYWVCGGNNNIIYWMPLPKIPEEDVR